jgi:hypothetical protein
MGEYEATEPHCRGSVIPCSLQTRKKPPYTLLDASYVARALVEMSQADYEFAIDCSGCTRPDKQVEPSFSLPEPARPQRRMDLVAGEIRIHWICILGGGPEVGMVAVPASDPREPAAEMECAPTVENHKAADNQICKRRINCPDRGCAKRAATNDVQLMEYVRGLGRSVALAVQSVNAHRLIPHDCTDSLA